MPPTPNYPNSVSPKSVVSALSNRTSGVGAEGWLDI